MYLTKFHKPSTKIHCLQYSPEFHLLRVGAIHKPRGTYKAALRSAKEKFCIDVPSRSVANSSNATMFRIVQLSTVVPTFLK
jgi:hypothetical protein